jgi:hypothetical protein
MTHTITKPYFKMIFNERKDQLRRKEKTPCVGVAFVSLSPHFMTFRNT